MKQTENTKTLHLNLSKIFQTIGKTKPGSYK